MIFYGMNSFVFAHTVTVALLDVKAISVLWVMSMLIRFGLYGTMGWLMEVLWTGFASFLKKDFRLLSTTSLWMFFIYGSAVFLEPLIELFSPQPFLIRGLIYMLAIFLAEFITGELLGRFNLCPWDYSASRYNVRGVIRLDYAPVWFFVGLTFERVYRIIR